MNFNERDFYQNDYGFGGNNIGQKTDCCNKTVEKSCYCCPVKWDENKNCNDKKDEKHYDKEYNCECRCKCEEDKNEKHDCCNRKPICDERHNDKANWEDKHYDKNNCGSKRCCNRCCFFSGFRF